MMLKASFPLTNENQVERKVYASLACPAGLKQHLQMLMVSYKALHS